MFFLRSSKLTWLASIAITVLHQTALAERRVACPADPSLIGYTSIDLLNADIDDELNAIRSRSKMMADSYQFTLCPFTVFSVSSNPILVTFNNTNIICGREGSIDDGCSVIGGYNQVMLSDSLSTKLNYASFRGIIFSLSEYVSIAAFANSEAQAEFHNCAWTYNTGGASILIRPRTSPSSSVSSVRHSVATKSTSSGKKNLRRQLLELDDTPFSTMSSNDNVRRVQQMSPAMTVRLFDCNFTNGFVNVSYGKIFSAVYSSGGSLHMDHVRVADNHGTLLFNLVDGGKAVVLNSTFVNNRADAIWRPIFSSTVQLDQVSFVKNKAEGIVVAIGNSQANVNQALFYDNVLNQGSNILILEQSRLQLYDSCFFQGLSNIRRNDTSLASIFVDSSSTLLANRNFANVSQGEYCNDPTNGTGILVESKGHDCLRNDCVGSCVPFASPVCSLSMPSLSDLTTKTTDHAGPYIATKQSLAAALPSSSVRFVVHESWGVASMFLLLVILI